MIYLKFIYFSAGTVGQSPMAETNQSLSDRCVDLAQEYKSVYNDWTMASLTQSFFAVLYFCIFLIGSTSNFFVIASVARRKSLQTVRNLFIVNLSISDTIVSLTSTIITPVTAMTKTWIFGPLLCLVDNQRGLICFSLLKEHGTLK